MFNEGGPNLGYGTHELTMRQQTTFTPRLQHSVKLLQMSTLEFMREIQETLATNPFLQEADDAVEGASPAASGGNDVGPTFTVAGLSAAMVASPPTLESAVADGESRLTDYAGGYPAPRTSAAGDADPTNFAQAYPTLKERLRTELCGYRLSQRDRMLVEYIVEALDDDGYLRVKLDELADTATFSPSPDETEWRTALKLVQQLDVPGLGARNLEECLLLQLDACDPATPGQHLAAGLVRHHLGHLARHNYAAIEQATRCSVDALRQACALIQQLDPKPGRRYDRKDPEYIVADVIVYKKNDQWQVVPNLTAMPRPRLHQTYADLFHNARCQDRTPMAQELQEARWLIHNVEQRYRTIQRVAAAIVNRQQMFFEYGQIALRPLMLKEIADEIEVHESTVSRATSNKYMVTPRGIFEFKHFFSRELVTESGGSCSAAAVRALIKELIEGENPRDPLSDVVLTRKLAEGGIVVARRTVSKYRAQLKCPAADMRRQY
jgi:RNA polymerase sigma-54 factor